MSLPSDILVVIPARRGSKGIPGKNWKPLGGRPLIQHSIEHALGVTSPAHICVTTDAPEALEIAATLGVAPGFVRPAELSTDESDSRSAILHALDAWERKTGNRYRTILVLQPTSPFRSPADILGAHAMYDEQLEMVVSAVETADNPYYSVFLADERGMLRKAIPSAYTRRQDCPRALVLNGAIYFIGVEAIRARPVAEFERIRCFEMSPEHHVDLDTPLDWAWAEFLIERGLVLSGV